MPIYRAWETLRRTGGHWIHYSLNETNDAFDEWSSEHPRTVQLWRSANWSPHEAFIWRLAGFTPDEAQQWTQVIPDLTNEQTSDIDDPDDWFSEEATRADLASEYVLAGFSPDDQAVAAHLSLTPPELRQWLDHNYSVESIQAWVDADVRNARIAVLWNTTGWTLPQIISVRTAVMRQLYAEVARTAYDARRAALLSVPANESTRVAMLRQLPYPAALAAACNGATFDSAKPPLPSN